MVAAKPTRFTAMQQKYAGAQLTPGEWEAFRLRFAGDTAPPCGGQGRAETALKLALDGDPGNQLTPPPCLMPSGHSTC